MSAAAAAAPVEIGTNGTIGSLLKREIDYFKRLEIDCSIESQRHVQEEMGSVRHGVHWPSFKFLSITWRKMRRKSSGIRHWICSVVEVADSHRVNQIPRFSYKNLRVDRERFDDHV